MIRERRPDLILLDLHLPDMNGQEVLRRLWASPSSRSIQVAVPSADATARQQQRLLAAGAVAYLTKPLDVSSLLQIVDERLRQLGAAGYYVKANLIAARARRAGRSAGATR